MVELPLVSFEESRYFEFQPGIHVVHLRDTAHGPLRGPVERGEGALEKLAEQADEAHALEELRPESVRMDAEKIVALARKDVSFDKPCLDEESGHRTDRRAACLDAAGHLFGVLFGRIAHEEVAENAAGHARDAPVLEMEPHFLDEMPERHRALLGPELPNVRAARAHDRIVASFSGFSQY
jgi:hypothetical protein